jgi:hypothetical protein
MPPPPPPPPAPPQPATTGTAAQTNVPPVNVQPAAKAGPKARPDKRVRTQSPTDPVRAEEKAKRSRRIADWMRTPLTAEEREKYDEDFRKRVADNLASANELHPSGKNWRNTVVERSRQSVKHGTVDEYEGHIARYDEMERHMLKEEIHYTPKFVEALLSLLRTDRHEMSKAPHLLECDDRGWVRTRHVLHALKGEFPQMTKCDIPTLVKIVHDDPKMRMQFSVTQIQGHDIDFIFIRATSGHDETIFQRIILST